MRTYTITFSPTGGTKKVADILSGALWQQVSAVDLTDSHTDFGALALTAEDVALIAVPSFSGRVPEIACQRLAAIQGGGAKAVLVCVYEMCIRDRASRLSAGKAAWVSGCTG